MALYQAPAGRKTFDGDVASRGGTQWRMTGYVAEATAYDERLEKDLGKPAHVTEPVVGVSTLRRANSGGSEQFKHRDDLWTPGGARLAPKTDPGAFVRCDRFQPERE